MEWLIGQSNWILFGVLFIGFLIYVRRRRREELRWIEKRFGGAQAVVTSFGVTFFGCENDPNPVRKRAGFLILLPDRLFFRSRTGEELDVPIHRVRAVDHDTAIKGKDLNQSVMILEFIGADGRADKAAFRVPYPPQWIGAVRAVSARNPRAPETVSPTIH